MALTPDQEKLKEAALAAPKGIGGWYGEFQIADGITNEAATRFMALANPAAILAILAQLELVQGDAALWQYIKATTTAIRNHETGEREECTPEQFEASVKRLLAAAGTPLPPPPEAA